MFRRASGEAKNSFARAEKSFPVCLVYLGLFPPLTMVPKPLELWCLNKTEIDDIIDACNPSATEEEEEIILLCLVYGSFDRW